MRPELTLLLALAASAASAAEFKTVALTKADVTRNVELLGEVRPYRQVTLTAKVAGHVKAIRVEIGDKVKAGQVLAELESPELSADLLRARAESTLAERDAARARDAARKAPDLVVKQALDAAESRAAAAKAETSRLEALLAHARITAPFDATVTRRFVDEGAFVPAATGAAAGQASIVTLTDSSKVRVQASVPEYEASLVSVGQPFLVAVDTARTRPVSARLTRHSEALDPASKTLLAEAEVANADGALRPGMFAKVKLGVETHAGANVLPLSAVTFEKTTAVAFVLADGKARRRVLKHGFNDGANIEVLEGVAAGENVIVTAGAALVDGQPVTIAK
ncbi:MAG: efflux RND transporter periplasmic adaptor subunit [Opitutia bacterium]